MFVNPKVNAHASLTRCCRVACQVVRRENSYPETESAAHAALVDRVTGAAEHESGFAAFLR